ncbi:unnamed protein product [Aspergillus oryzae var. brunneus]|uniref:Unnamed protein product n=2 Tax=Aspergillus oryzae TaxID=5062 RepID=A0AAN4YPH8_ASPOZ|nr:unnamed protein product [Aspergillus oryzae]GMG31218.1 unnamed protein product [Aspergillus oryzae]GMG50609.1 unnamed protein product [Aspergillus oryzae var. brunneus]
MPCDGRNARIHPATSRNSINAFACFSMEDLNSITAAAYFVTSTANKSSVKAPAHPADGPTIITRHGASTNPIRCIPEGDKGVAAADGEIASSRCEGNGKAGGCVSIKGVEDVEGWVG